ncbi:LytTR family DNA-binding domain-containing protein [Mesobacterium sp. TK19101]|uniref:LytTR family DNA-binding domain-containing protein n=1 Tax=Mesobacterium hydrothermale TaxID=3111907 RepID=A0ABU6HCR8_9RHOB|nr:LytTR family DNA-binding domain-containing protein [Mesobacterium sp. TK19101]MEC3859917.1 LytTR family DNA-binding domain-containing protein [Mesobacterium sp. TK19101]
MYVISVLLFSILVALADPLLFQHQVILPLRVLFWLSNAGFLAICWILLFTLSLWLFAQNPRAVVPSALFIVPSVVAAVALNYWTAAVVLNRPELLGPQVLSDMVRYSLLVIVFEAVIQTFVLPRVMDFAPENTATTPLEPPRPATAPDPVFHWKDRAIATDRVLYLRSVEHYVEIVTDDGTDLVRARLADFLNQPAARHGVQTHRSYWVNAGAVTAIDRQNGNLVLTLSNGAEIPVSRNRRKDVLDRIGP